MILDQYKSCHDPSTLLEEGLGIIRVMQDIGDDDEIEALIWEWKMMAIKRMHLDEGFLSDQNINSRQPDVMPMLLNSGGKFATATTNIQALQTSLRQKLHKRTCERLNPRG